MLVVTVEEWPGGSARHGRVIHTLKLANVSGPSDVGDYKGAIDGEPVSVVGHRRSDGAWELVWRVLEQRHA